MAKLLTDGAQAASAAALFELAFARLAPAPGAGELPVNPGLADDGEEPRAAAFAVLGQTGGQVGRGAEIVPGVFEPAVEVQQVHHAPLLHGAGSRARSRLVVTCLCNTSHRRAGG